MNADLVPRR